MQQRIHIRMGLRLLLRPSSPRRSRLTMTPLERAYLYGIGILALMLGTTRGVNHWIGRLEERYWQRH